MKGADCGRRCRWGDDEGCKIDNWEKKGWKDQGKKIESMNTPIER